MYTMYPKPPSKHMYPKQQQLNISPVNLKQTQTQTPAQKTNQPVPQFQKTSDFRPQIPQTSDIRPPQIQETIPTQKTHPVNAETSQQITAETILQDIVASVAGEDEVDHLHSTLKRLLQRWDELSTEGVHTHAHTQQQKRLFPLLLISPPDRYKYVTQQKGWSAATRASYWATISGVAALVDPTNNLPRQLQLFQRKLNAAAQLQPSWSPEDSMAYATQKQMWLIWECEALAHWTRIVLMLCFLLGQRVSDTLKWRTSNLTKQKFPYIEGEMLSMVVVEGKTVEKTGAYTLHIPTNSFSGALLTTLSESPSGSGKYLFFQSSELMEKAPLQQYIERLEKWIHKDLQAQHLDMDLRACRRGGLSLMALNGYSLETIRLFSQHASVEILKRYLAQDLFNGNNAATMAEMIAYQEIRPQEVDQEKQM